MSIELLIAFVVLVFFIAVVSFYIFKGISGPRKIEDIRKLMQQSRYDEAIRELNAIIEKDDRNIEAHYLLAECYNATKNHHKAILHCRRLTKMGRYSPEVSEIKIRTMLASSLAAVGNLTEAKNEYLILTTLDKNNFKHFYNVGEIFFRSNVLSKAQKFLMKAAQLNNRHPETQALLGQCFYQERNYPEARAALLKAVEIKPSLYDAHYYLGMTLRFMGDLEWAIKEFDIAAKDEKLRSKTLMAKGMALIDQENYSRAISELEKAIKFAPPRSDLMIQIQYLIALAYEKSRDLPAAIKAWEFIDAIKPGFKDVAEKLRQYKEFRTDDVVKDFLIAGTAQFEGIVRKIIESMNLSISDLKMLDDTTIRLVGTEKESRQRNIRRQNYFFWIQRDVAPVKEDTIRDIHEKMKEEHANRAYAITAGEFTPSAVQFASSRPIELIDAGKLAELLKKALT